MPDQPTGHIADGLHILPLRIFYEDTDMSGVVYHANYLRYMERGRSDFLRMIGVSHTELLARPDPISWALIHIDVRFVKPARIEDAIEVHTRYAALRGARLHIDQEVVRGGEVLVRARVTAACVRPDGRAARMPRDMLAKLAPYLGSAEAARARP